MAAPINPTTQGVIPLVETNGKWIRAEKTTLGADNGIGLAAALAILDHI